MDMTIREAASAWGITERRITELCKSGRIPGAYKMGRRWFIPDHALKPKDNRYRKHAAPTLPHPLRKPLPIGESDYRKACSNYYYVDKTMMLKEILDERPVVSLYTRPRRFGKTLNMSMLRVFFEKTEGDTSVYFREKKIWGCGKEYRDHQGKYPVVYLSFKDVKADSWEETYRKIRLLIAAEFRRHHELSSSSQLDAFERQKFACLASETADKVDYESSLSFLMLFLHKHHGVAPIVIIDEYDTPIQQGHLHGFYDTVTFFMRNFFSAGLKDNDHLSFGFLTGILRVAKESIFSGLNNLKVYSVLEDRYSEYFGFTPDEVQEMAAYYDAAEKYQELCDWYDGYRFGHTEIFNPWSVISYFDNDCVPRAFWQSTSSNDVIHEVLSAATPDILENLERLLRGESFATHIDTSIIYPRVKDSPSSVYSFLLVAGYLKAISCDNSYGDDVICDVALPNKEVSFVYSKEILSQFRSIVPESAVVSIRTAIHKMDVKTLQTSLEQFLLQTISFHDAASEAFYHGLVLGLCAMLDGKYRLSSNREAGTGRFDIQLLPLKKQLPGILIELKAEKDCSERQLEALASRALQQIEDRSYDTEMLAQGITALLKYGIAFSGKKVRICADSKWR